MIIRIALAALAAALLTAGAAASAGTTATTAAAAGGLSISPGILERDAQPGPVGTVRVANGSSRSVAVVVAARPWTQARGGTVRPDVRRRLSAVRLSATSFRLAPGESRAITVTLTRRPSSGSVYGAVEVIGTPQGPRPTNGVVTRYRLIGGLRLNPPLGDRRLRVSVGAARAASGVVIAVRNTGNTAEPLTGTARITGPAGTVRTTIAAQRILPRATVDVRLHAGRLQQGRYTAAVTLRQGGRQVATVTRTFRVA